MPPWERWRLERDGSPPATPPRTLFPRRISRSGCSLRGGERPVGRVQRDGSRLRSLVLPDLLVHFRDLLLVRDPPLGVALRVELLDLFPLLLHPRVVLQVVPAAPVVNGALLDPVDARAVKDPDEPGRRGRFVDPAFLLVEPLHDASIA